MLITDSRLIRQPPVQKSPLPQPQPLGEKPDVIYVKRTSPRLKSISKKPSSVVPEYYSDGDKDFLDMLMENGATDMVFSSEEEYTRNTVPESTPVEPAAEIQQEPISKPVTEIEFYEIEAAKFGKENKCKTGIDVADYVRNNYRINSASLYKKVLGMFTFSFVNASLEELNRTSVIAALALAL